MENGNEMVTKAIFLGGMQDMETRMAILITESVDNFARLVNKGFVDMEECMLGIESRMATKEDLMVLEKKLEGKIDGVDAYLSAYVTQWNREFEVHDAQLRALEKR